MEKMYIEVGKFVPVSIHIKDIYCPFSVTLYSICVRYTYRMYVYLQSKWYAYVTTLQYRAGKGQNVSPMMKCWLYSGACLR